MSSHTGREEKRWVFKFESGFYFQIFLSLEVSMI